MGGPRDCHTESSKSEREKQISVIKAYMQNLEKWYRCVQGRHRKQEWRTDVWTEGGEVGVRQIERAALTYIHCRV